MKVVLRVEQSQNNVNEFAVVGQDGVVMATAETAIDAANVMFAIIKGNVKKYTSEQSMLELYGFQDEDDVRALQIDYFEGREVNLDLYLEYRQQIVARVRAEECDVCSPSEVVMALDGCVLGAMLQKIAIWGFKHYGSLALPLGRKSRTLVNKWLTRRGFDVRAVRFDYVDVRSACVVTEMIDIADDIRILLDISGPDVFKVQVVANTIESAKAFDVIEHEKVTFAQEYYELHKSGFFVKPSLRKESSKKAFDAFTRYEDFVSMA